MPGLLAIDQATTVGWAFCEPGKEPQWGHKRMGWRPKEGEAGPSEGMVFFHFRNFLLDAIGRFKPDYLIYERPFVPRADSKPGAPVQNAEVLARAYGLAAHITELAEEFNIDYRDYDSRAFTKFFTGKGSFPGKTVAERRAAKKNATVAACDARGWRATQDEADALALLMFAEFKLYPQAALSRRMVLKQPSGPLFGRGS